MPTQYKHEGCGSALHERSTTTGAGAGGATEAVVASENLAILNRRRIEFPKMKRPVSVSPVHLQHLIEVAVEDFARPTDADSIATH
jgi:hypothetical protein